MLYPSTTILLSYFLAFHHARTFFERGVGVDFAHISFFLRDAMRRTRNCLSYDPDIPVRITYASNRSDICHWSN